MSSFFTTSATDNSAFTVVPGLASGPELPSADQVAIIRQIHMNFVDQHVKELEAARQEKEVEVKSVTEKMEREMEERDEINKRNTVSCIYNNYFGDSNLNNYQEYLREFWNEARSGRKAEADRAFLLDANLAKKTEECNGLTARVAALKKTLACVNVRASGQIQWQLDIDRLTYSKTT